MEVALAPNSLMQEVLSGSNRELLELAASGFLPLPPEQLLPVQVALARGDDWELGQRARESLRGMARRVAAPYLAQAAGPAELAFFAAEVSHPLIVETILRRRDVPRLLLVDLARRLPGDLQELLLLRQDAIVEEPAILNALEEQRQLTPYTQRRIKEDRQHLLPQRHRAVREDVLLEVAKRREWVARYSICRALISNPKTPVAISVRLLPKMSVRDLRLMSRDRNVADAVRSSATRLYTIKQK